jgi:hypothetical protein
VANGDEAAFEFDVFQAAVHGAFQAHAGHAGVVTQHLFQGLEGLEHDLARSHFVHQLVHQDGLGLEFVAAVDQIDLAGDVGQVQGFFDGGVAATHDAADLVAVEEAIAGGAAAHAAAHEGSFRGQAQVFGRCAGGDDQAVAGVGATVADQGEGPLLKLHGVDVVKHDLGVEALGMLLETLHQVRTLDTVHVSGPVVHFGGGHELTALSHAGDQKRFQVSAGGVNRCGVPGRAGAENQNLGMFGSGGHGEQSGRAMVEKTKSVQSTEWRDCKKHAMTSNPEGYRWRLATGTRGLIG